MATKSKVIEVRCECGNQWYATFRSGIVKSTVLCGHCGKETKTIKSKKRPIPDVCPGCQRPDYQNPRHDYTSCKFCKYSVYDATLARK